MKSRAARFGWPLVWLALAALLVARATDRPPTRGVILDHLEFGRRLVLGEDVYGPWQSDADAPVRPLHAPYPPSFGLLAAPFAAIDATFGQRPARASWALLQVLALLVLAWQLRRLAPRAPPGRAASWHWLWFGTFLLGARFILRDTHGGGGNLINTALCVFAFGVLERRPWLAGLLLGFSLATKPTQLWLLPVLLVLGRGRALGWTLAAGLGCVVVTLVLQRLDLAPWLRWLEGSYRLGTQADPWADPALEFPPFEWMNQSLRLGVARWCGTVPPEFAARVEWGVAPGLGLDVPTVGWIGRILALTLLGWLLLACRRLRGSREALPWLLAAALVLSVMLSPLSWKAHHVALLPVLFLLLHAAVCSRSRALAVVLGLWALCCNLGGDLIGDAADEWLNSVYIVTLWDLVLFGMALWYARRATTGAGDAART